MSIRQMVKVWDVRGLDASARLVLLKLCDCADDEGRNAFPSLDTVATDCELSRNTVRRAIVRLVELEHVSVQAQATTRRPAVYTVHPGGPNLGPQGNSGVPSGVPPRDPRGATDDVQGSQPRSPYKEDPSVPVSTPGTVQVAAFGPDELMALWNAIVTSPIPKCKQLSKLRRSLLKNRLREIPSPDDWRAIITHINGQSWCRAPGTGDYPNWTAHIDWLMGSGARPARILEQLATRATRTAPTREAGVKATRDANVQHVAEQDFCMPGGADHDTTH